MSKKTFDVVVTTTATIVVSVEADSNATDEAIKDLALDAAAEANRSDWDLNDDWHRDDAFIREDDLAA